ncbi:antigen WC1.1-like isoform X2 [Rhinatrema bivittatum]|uniref:antigen WC1.1-like isoform X2 n=1 Tax=Rhinatrema bivittatum TaxID=194408 RepID=UPI00112C9689|nr:antigen WC1.1-like isoform X2 [Rhinatrema bivittatum]XP_029440934.1 antigen WC1.1-like isoform X2 [Rhinatrema bivittatum]
MLLWLIVSGQPLVRLVNGSSRCAGRVEIFYNNAWGSVCDDGWDSRAGQVVCRQLDCGVVLSAPGNALFGQGLGPIWLDDVYCNGSEYLLSMCPAKPWGINDCRYHAEDASVVCSAELPKPNISTLAQAESSQHLICRIPKLHLDTTVYFYQEGPRHQVAVRGVSMRQDTALYAANESGEYTCLYEVRANRTEQNFQSLHSDPVRLSIGPATFTSDTGLPEKTAGSLTSPISFTHGLEPKEENTNSGSGSMTRPSTFTHGLEPKGPDPSLLDTSSPVVTAAVVVGAATALALLGAGLLGYYIRRRKSSSSTPALSRPSAKEPDESNGSSRTSKHSTGIDDQGYATIPATQQHPSLYESLKLPGANHYSRDPRAETVPGEGLSGQPGAEGGHHDYEDLLVQGARPEGGPYENVTPVGQEAKPEENHYQHLKIDPLQENEYETLKLAPKGEGGLGSRPGM